MAYVFFFNKDFGILIKSLFSIVDISSFDIVS